MRRMEVSSGAKLFVVDDFTFEVSAADDGVCGPTPGGARRPADRHARS